MANLICLLLHRTAEPSVLFGRFEQLFVRAAPDDLPFFQYQNGVGVFDGAEAVGDDDGDLVSGVLLQGVLDAAFAFVVQCARGFVEDQHGGFFVDGPGDGDALALAAGEVGAELVHLGVDALAQALGEIQRIGTFEGFDDAGFVYFVTVGYVRGETVLEDVDALRYDGDVLTQGVLLQLFDGDAVDGDGTGVGVVKTDQRVNEGAFAAPAVADERDGLFVVDLEVDVLQCGRIVVLQRDVVESDRFDGLVQNDGTVFDAVLQL